MGLFERYLTVWVFLGIVAGVALGHLFPGVFEAIASLEIARVNMVVAVLIWLMIYPMMLKVEPGCLKDVGRAPKGLMLTLTVNWLIKPFTMAALATLFFKGVYSAWITDAQAQSVIAGMILLGVAPCTAMVFVWSQMTRGDANYTLVQVSLNDLILIFAFAPITALLLDVTDVVIPWKTLALSVVLFVVLPLMAGVITNTLLSKRDDDAVDHLSQKLKPWSITGLIMTVVLLFGLQAGAIIARPIVVLMIALPLTIQSYGIFAVAYLGARVLKLPFSQAAPAAMIGTSSFFELAVAVAISLFGLSSYAALATVVGVLIEVPIMLSLVYFANRTEHWFDVAQPNMSKQ